MLMRGVRKHDDDFSDATKYAREILRKADVGDTLPTPVDDVVACADLVVSGEVDLSPRHFDAIASSKKILLSILVHEHGSACALWRKELA
jgi:hypothetical protein